MNLSETFTTRNVKRFTRKIFWDFHFSFREKTTRMWMILEIWLTIPRTRMGPGWANSSSQSSIVLRKLHWLSPSTNAPTYQPRILPPTPGNAKTILSENSWVTRNHNITISVTRMSSYNCFRRNNTRWRQEFWDEHSTQCMMRTLHSMESTTTSSR